MDPRASGHEAGAGSPARIRCPRCHERKLAHYTILHLVLTCPSVSSGLAARPVPSAAGRRARPQQEPRRLPQRRRASRFFAGIARAGHRAVPRHTFAVARILLSRCPDAPPGDREHPPNPGQLRKQTHVSVYRLHNRLTLPLTPRSPSWPSTMPRTTSACALLPSSWRYS